MQELVVDTFVPNDTYLIGGAGTGVTLDDDDYDDDGEDEHQYVKNSIMVCTGANACGKVVSRVISLYATLIPAVRIERIPQANRSYSIHGAGMFIFPIKEPLN